jgi:NAD(P)H-dependent FMN reductase
VRDQQKNVKSGLSSQTQFLNHLSSMNMQAIKNAQDSDSENDKNKPTVGAKKQRQSISNQTLKENEISHLLTKTNI